MKTVFIYALRDAKTGRPDYVGVTSNIQKRYRKSVFADGTILAEVPWEARKAWETHFIKYFLDIGYVLRNINMGGGGPAQHTPAARAKMLGRISWNKGLRKIWPGEDKAPTSLDLTKFFAWCLIKISVTGARRRKSALGNTYGIGYRHTKEALEKISEASKGNTFAGGRPRSDEEKFHNASLLVGKKTKRNTSGLVGVWLVKKTGKWIAAIRYLGKAQHLGTFHTKEAAAEAYEKAFLKFYGKEFSQERECVSSF